MEQDGSAGADVAAETKRQKDESWAVYTEENAKGAGNTMNRCAPRLLSSPVLACVRLHRVLRAVGNVLTPHTLSPWALQWLVAPIKFLASDDPSCNIFCLPTFAWRMSCEQVVARTSSKKKGLEGQLDVAREKVQP